MGSNLAAAAMTLVPCSCFTLLCCDQFETHAKPKAAPVQKERCFLGINPETGCKAKKKRGVINPHVSTFFRKLLDFEWTSM
ncbi:23-bisphosphoglycerate-independent phosphoglycerate mutase [Dissostichus eleginoides]|uniref:23-bisphosphoglycerate-independent phosphoglycerate mutase n=1 Tax=Dissostichus eleginoides TaxID=100907 RepID=A0AAD9BI45_DISEL|nr:23-bisphosphoglycerate-independent phosphoglycerate mutase [Dissostichus eleginoides]